MPSYVIGDIHGCLEELARLMESLPLKSSDRLIFLGDYIDRGPDSMGVINYLLGWRNRQDVDMVFLKGNHEDMFLSYIGLSGNHGDAFLFNGGNATLASYGISPTESAARISSAIPASHLEFFDSLKAFFTVDSFLCVHAGVHPRKTLGQQSEEEMLWIRESFIHHAHSLPYTVVFGHTPQRDILFHLPYKIGLDTGLVYGNQLSCLEVTERNLFQIKRGQKVVSQKNVNAYWKENPHILTFPRGGQ